MTTQTTQPDLVAIKGKQQQTWSAGDFGAVGVTLNIVGEHLNEAACVGAGERVLDVATGNGNAALAAARRFADVTGVDYVPALLEGARRRAAADGLTATFIEGDAEAIPAPDGAYDVTLSTFGSMFAPNQPRAASELLRVTRAGGRIGMANWTPEGFIGEMFRVTGRLVPPPAGLTSPMRWGTEDGLRELFGDGISDLTVRRRNFVFRYRSPEHWVAFFREFYGPTLKAFAALDAAGQAQLEADLLDLARRHNRSKRGALAVPSEYLEVVALRA